MKKAILFISLLFSFYGSVLASENAPVKLADSSRFYEHKMGVILTSLSANAYDSIIEGVPNSRLLFEIKRNSPECFDEEEYALNCTMRIECNKEERRNLLVCPLSTFNKSDNEELFLLKDTTDEFYIQVVLTYPRIITHNPVREVIERSPVMSLDELPQG
ncbi:hypothetical protein K1X76_04360 [bacterium]|nr:hypothetical protein [bacterium]